MILDFQVLDCLKNLSIFEGVRPGNDFRFPDFRLFFLNVSILEGV